MVRKHISYKFLVLPVVLVAIFFSLYGRQSGKESPALSGKPQSKKKGIRAYGSGSTESTTSVPPTPSPLPHDIEIKTVAQVQQYVVDDTGTTTTTDRRMPPAHYYTESEAELMYKNITYRFPSQAFFNFSESSLLSSSSLVVVGVLSAPAHVSRRNVIRQTWAFGRSNVFFLVSGPWENLIDEIRYQRDIFWVNAPEGIDKLVLKSQTFVIATQKHLKTKFHFILKTDDDSYLRLAHIEKLVSSSSSSSSSTRSGSTSSGTGQEVARTRDIDENNADENESDESNGGDANTKEESTTKYESNSSEGTVTASSESEFDWATADYIGTCIQNRPIHIPLDKSGGIVVSGGSLQFPSYASGAGYLVSAKFAECFARVAAVAPVLSTIEDVNTGLYADICHMPCHHSNRILNYPDASILKADSTSDYLVAHYLGSHGHINLEDILVTLHAHSCNRADADPISCAEGSYRTAPRLPMLQPQPPLPMPEKGGGAPSGTDDDTVTSDTTKAEIPDESVVLDDNDDLQHD